MASHVWDCTDDHDRWDCPIIFPTSNVRVVTDFDRHADQAIALANGGNA